LWMNREGQFRSGIPGSGRTYDPSIKGLEISFDDPVLTVKRGTDEVRFTLGAALQSEKPSADSPVLIPAYEGRNRALLILVHPSQFPKKQYATKMFEVWILLNTTPATHGQLDSKKS
ncbi:MAG TPA: hypothetical protein VMT58_08295, partial [Candidatus Binataceae bacterium]|nr:hypothetical protein [Candidatus Binataceae bacterium]